ESPEFAEYPAAFVGSRFGFGFRDVVIGTWLLRHCGGSPELARKGWPAFYLLASIQIAASEDLKIGQGGRSPQGTGDSHPEVSHLTEDVRAADVAMPGAWSRIVK